MIMNDITAFFMYKLILIDLAKIRNFFNFSLIVVKKINVPLMLEFGK